MERRLLFLQGTSIVPEGLDPSQSACLPLSVFPGLAPTPLFLGKASEDTPQGIRSLVWSVHDHVVAEAVDLPASLN